MKSTLTNALEAAIWAILAVIGMTLTVAVLTVIFMATAGAWAIGIGQIIGWVLQ